MSYLIAYVTILVVFGVIDAVWLSQMAGPLYRATLGDIMVDTIRVAPAVVFYLAFPVGLVVFAVMPGLESGGAGRAFLLGALFGALCYGTYDLTNFATLKNWTLQITLIDIAYGAIVAGVSAAAAVLAVQGYAGR